MWGVGLVVLVFVGWLVLVVDGFFIGYVIDVRRRVFLLVGLWDGVGLRNGFHWVWCFPGLSSCSTVTVSLPGF